ncbi:MAG: hypothetical protein ACM3SU_13305 [Acidobacteriota bacterium]
MGARRFAPVSLLWLVRAGAAPPAACAATITVNRIADAATSLGECTPGEAIIAANSDTASGAARERAQGGDMAASSFSNAFSLLLYGP